MWWTVYWRLITGAAALCPWTRSRRSRWRHCPRERWVNGTIFLSIDGRWEF